MNTEWYFGHILRFRKYLDMCNIPLESLFKDENFMFLPLFQISNLTLTKMAYKVTFFLWVDFWRLCLHLNEFILLAYKRSTSLIHQARISKQEIREILSFESIYIHFYLLYKRVFFICKQNTLSLYFGECESTFVKG